MIEDTNPLLNVDELMARVRAQIDAGSAASRLPVLLNSHAISDAPTIVAGIENDLASADAFSQVRTSLGVGATSLGPFVALQGFLLRILAFVFRDQRNVNTALSNALRKSLQLNVHVLEECEQLKSRLADLEAAKRRRKA